MDIPIHFANQVCASCMCVSDGPAVQLVAFGRLEDSKVSASAFNFEGQHRGPD